VTESGLRGRGGAGFPTGIKWKTVLKAPAPRKYIVCNADEGDSGHLRRPHDDGGRSLHADRGHGDRRPRHGATKGYVYLRSEYPDAIEVMDRAIEHRARGRASGRRAGLGPRFDMEVRVGAGAYVCGEETSLLNSLEGKRGVVRAKPPLPAHKGFLGRPTVVNNVISLATVPVIFDKGADFIAISAGPVARHDPDPDRRQREIWRAVRDGLRHDARRTRDDIGGGTATGRPVKAVQVGGPLGRLFRWRRISTRRSGYEEFDGARAG
jgi:formate dehydrogenase iron-sulfur subunit